MESCFVGASTAHSKYGEGFDSYQWAVSWSMNWQSVDTAFVVFENWMNRWLWWLTDLDMWEFALGYFSTSHLNPWLCVVRSKLCGPLLRNARTSLAGRSNTTEAFSMHLLLSAQNLKEKVSFSIVEHGVWGKAGLRWVSWFLNYYFFLNISFTVSSRLNKRSEKTEWAQGADDGRERQILNQHAPQELRPLTPLEWLFDQKN